MRRGKRQQRELQPSLKLYHARQASQCDNWPGPGAAPRHDTPPSARARHFGPARRDTTAKFVHSGRSSAAGASFDFYTVLNNVAHCASSMSSHLIAASSHRHTRHRTHSHTGPQRRQRRQHHISAHTHDERTNRNILHTYFVYHKQPLQFSAAQRACAAWSTIALSGVCRQLLLCSQSARRSPRSGQSAHRLTCQSQSAPGGRPISASRRRGRPIGAIHVAGALLRPPDRRGARRGPRSLRLRPQCVRRSIPG